MRGGIAGISNAVSSNRRSEIFFVEGMDIGRARRVACADLPVGQFARKGRSEVLQIIRFPKAMAAWFVVRTFVVVEVPGGMRARPSSRFFWIQFRPRKDHEGKRVADEQYRNINGRNVDSGAEESRIYNLCDALEVGVQ